MQQHPPPPPVPLPPFRRSELDSVGLSRRDLNRMLTAGQVLQPLRGVYVDARTADDDEEVRKAIEFDGEEDHTEQDDQQHDDVRRERLRREHGWTVWAVRKDDVLGRRLGVELAVGELLSLEPQIRQRRW